MFKAFLSHTKGLKIRTVCHIVIISCLFSLAGLIFSFGKPQSIWVMDHISARQGTALRLLWLTAYIVSGFIVFAFSSVNDGEEKYKSVILMVIAAIFNTITPPLFIYSENLFIPFVSLLASVMLIIASGACMWEKSRKISMMIFICALLFASFFIIVALM